MDSPAVWLQSVLDNLIEGCQIIDRDYRYVYLNETALKHAERLPEELIGQCMMDVYPGIEQTEMFDHLKRCMEERVIETFSNEFMYPDGHTGHFELRMFPAPAGVLVMSVDVTQHVRTREALDVSVARAMQAERLAQIGQLAGGLAHDYNNMLLVMQTCTDLALEEMRAGGSPMEYLGQVREAIDRSAALTRGLLAFSGRQALEPRATQLDRLVSNFEVMLRGLVPDTVRLQLSLGETRACLVDPVRIEQVIVNLVINACDAMPDGGTLRIETFEAELDEDDLQTHPGAKVGEHAVLKVTDTGMGMDAQTRARIFEPFFTTKGEGKGTGLGLANVYGTVSQSEGTIWVYSEPGKGTTFKIYLPLMEEAVRVQAVRVPEPEKPSKGVRVLVVDDEHLVRRTVCTVLQRSGYETVSAPSVPEALRIADAGPDSFDVVVTDVVMPSGDGRDLAEALWKVRPDLPILFMSGFETNGHGIDVEATHHAGWIDKPFRPKELVGKIEGLLAKVQEPVG